MSRQPILLAILLPFILPILGATPAPSSLPAVDFSRMGTVGLGGSFAGLDWWSDQSPFASSSSSSSSPRFSSEGDTVFMRGGDGGYRSIGVTNPGGVVNDVCWVSGEGSGTVYVGGSFTSIGGQARSNIAAYSLSSGTWSMVASGLTGSVNTLSCDSDRKEVWIGGQFPGPNGNGSNVALWSTSSLSWQPIPFVGLNGPVSIISRNPSTSNLYFGGAFSTSFSSNSTLNITTNYTSTPSAPSNTSTTGNSGFLTPVTLPASSSAQGQLTITAGPATADTRYNDPRVMLCPGSGTWLAVENQVSDVNLLGYNFWRASGARVRNALVEGRGTTTFCLTSIPDNLQLNMTYTDPKTGKNATCWDHCPLSTDSSIGAQDFVFTDGPRNMTGLQMQLKTWIGQGAGLSSVELLSPGAFASSSSDGNTGICPGATSSSVRTTGNWTQGTVHTSIAATTAFFIKSMVSSPPPNYPSVTFYPQVSSAGYYDINIPIPACSKTEDCGSRTSVDMTIFPRADGMGFTSTISQVADSDQSVLVYSGWIDKTDADFTPTVMLALAKAPAGTTSGQLSIVAQSVELVLTGVGNPGETPRTSPGGIVGQNGTIITNSTRVGVPSQAGSFGVFEWARGAAVNAASGTLSNSTQTALTRLGSVIDTARNGSAGARAWSVNAIVPVGNTIYVSGQFAQSGNWSNVLAIDTTSNATVVLPDGGLNGIVYAAVTIGQNIFFGGNFTGTSSRNLQHVARYDTSARSWTALAGGVDGAVTGLSVNNNQLVLVGNFTRVIAADGASTSTGGYAVYDTTSSSWSTSGILFGTLSTAVTVGNGSTIVAGRVLGSSSNSVNGIAMLSTGSSGAEISTLQGVSFSSTGSAASSAPAKREFHSRHQSRNWMNRLAAVLTPLPIPIPMRNLVIRAPAPAIPASSASAPAVLAGGFWTNSSASGRPQVTILGGNFTTSGANIGGLAFYANNALSGPSPSVGGVVRTLAVIGDTVYAAGSSVNVTGVGSGMVAYDLVNGRWSSNRIPVLNPQTGSTLVVDAVKQRDSLSTVVVAGNFASAGGLACAAVCLWDVSGGQWSSPGSGLSSGEVRAIDFAGSDYDILFAAGSFVLPTGETSYVATYTFSEAAWRPLGTLPGPALAVAVDNKNASSIFAAGYSSSDNSPYLSQWTGSSWSAQNSSLLPGSIVSQLAFVPLQREHSGTGMMERDRMLMMSGNLYLDSVGNATSALYDGSRSYPYLAGVGSGGSLASSSNLFWSESSFDFTIRRYLATGLVVLVAMAIATGLILLLILLFLLIGYCLRRKERKRPHPEMYNKDPADLDASSDISSTHQNVLHTVQHAIQATLIGGAPAAAASKVRSREARTSGASQYAADAESEEESEEGGRETTMRYDFDGPDLQPGEMSMRAGQRVLVLDDQQSEEWWFCREPISGREGVVPATYVW